MRQKLEQTALRLFLYDFWDCFSDVTFFLISAHDILLIILKFAFFLTEKSLLWSYMGPMTLMQKLEFLHGYWWFKKKKKIFVETNVFHCLLTLYSPSASTEPGANQSTSDFMSMKSLITTSVYIWHFGVRNEVKFLMSTLCHYCCIVQNLYISTYFEIQNSASEVMINSICY